MKKKCMTRRDFLRAAALTPLAGAMAQGMMPSKLRSQALSRARVVLVRDEDALIEYKKPDGEIIQSMLDQAVTSYFDEEDVVAAWKRIIRPSDIVGLKSNVWRYIPTTKEVENAIIKRLMDVGVKRDNIGVDDRGVRRNPLFQTATALINARPGRTHHWSGVGSLIKNYIMFVPSPPAYHGDSCADLAAIWDKDGLKEKTKLNVLVMLYPQFHGTGPHSYNDKYIWEYKGILVGEDPVAVDTIGLKILQAKRKKYFGEEKPLATSAKHVRLADTRHGLGVGDPDRIELIKIGWQKDILI